MTRIVLNVWHRAGQHAVRPIPTGAPCRRDHSSVLSLQGNHLV